VRLALSLVLALVVAGAPAVQARTAHQPAHSVKCKAKKKGHPKPKKRCKRKRRGAHHITRPPQPVSGPQPAAPPAAPPPVVDPPAVANPAPTPAKARLGVVAREWSLVLSRASLPAGVAIVELQNFGEDAHNLRIERTDRSGAAANVPLAEAGERKSGEVTLAPGTYKLYCTLAGHEAQGMRASLTVGG
jgi:plastocyanin